MNTQGAIDALREIRVELPRAVAAGDVATVTWIHAMAEEVEVLAREIRTSAAEELNALQPREAAGRKQR